MGLDYGFEFVTRTGELDRLLGALADELSPPDGMRIRAVLPWRAEREHLVLGRRVGLGIRGLGGDVCLSLWVEPDTDSMRRFHAMGRARNRGTAERMAFGCMWTRLAADETWACLVLTAATSTMSRDLMTSKNLLRLASGVAERSGAHAFLDDEQDGRSILLVREGALHRVHPRTGLPMQPGTSLLRAAVWDALRARAAAPSPWEEEWDG